MLAIQGTNIAADDDDFLFVPELVTNGLDVFTEDVGFFSSPTPGQINPNRFSLAPRISDVSHSPLQPGIAEPLIVTATIESTINDVANVDLVYRVMYEEEVSLTMVDDGSGVDLVAGDGVYTSVIPAGVAQPGEMLRYFVTATDTVDDQMRSPRILDTSGTDRSPEYYGTVIVDPNVVSALPVFQWFAERESRARTRGGSRVSVFYHGEFYDNVFARQRGGATNGNSQKFNFNDDQPFFVNDTLGRVAEINLNAQGSDPSFLRQVLAFETYRDAGNPSEESFLMLMRANADRDRVGVFIEQIDEDFLERNGLDPDGALYKFVQRSNLDPVFSDTTTGIEKKTRQDEGNADIQAVVDGLSTGTAEERARSVFDHFNLATLMNYLAARSITMEADDVRKNFYLYRDTNGTGQWAPMPWDKDWTFGIEGDGGPELSHPFFGDQVHRKPNANQWNRLYEAVFNDPVLSEMYLRRLRTVMDQLLQPPGTSDQDGHYEQRIEELLATAEAELTSSAVGQAATIRRFLDARRQTLYLDQSIDKLITGEIKVIVPEFAQASYFIPGDNALGTDWTAPDFDDGQWSQGETGIGFSGGEAFDGLIRTQVNLRDVSADGTSVFLRIPFNVDDPASVNALTLRMKYDDGFVAYLNGTEVHRQSLREPDGPQFYDSRGRAHSNSLAVMFENFNITSHLDTLRPGENILAIHALNSSKTSSDMLVLPELIDGVIADTSVAGVPHEQIGNAPLVFGAVEHNPASGNQDEEFIEIQNPLDTAVDISGWKLQGGVEHTFLPGTVIPSQASLFVSPNAKAFMDRSEGPRGGQGLVVQGNYQGHLSNFGEPLELVAPSGDTIDSLTTPVEPTDAQLYLRLSEVNYHPASDTEATEFIELTNISDTVTLDLAGVVISDGPAEPYVFGENLQLAPGAHVVVTRDLAAFAELYPGVTANGPFIGTLDNGGERIKLADANGSTILEFEYSDNALWPQAADGAGASLELIDPANTSVNELGEPERWRSSAEYGGSPGRAGLAPAGIVINEVLSNSDAAGDVDAIELFNPTQEAIDLSGWWLSDSVDDLTKFQISAGTTLGAGEYLVLTEQQFNQVPGDGFALNGSEGDDVWLVIADNVGNPAAFVDDVHFGPARPDESFGRAPNGSGRLAPMEQNSFGDRNSEPRVGPIVISELNYNPGEVPVALLEIDPSLDEGDLEFIEIYNPTNAPIDLDQWRIRGDVDFDFNQTLIVAPNQAIVVVSFNPEKLGNTSKANAFRSHYGLDESVVVIGGYSGQLSDSGQRIQLQRPDVTATPVIHYYEDEVTFDDRDPWPTSADGFGDSLQRLAMTDFGNAATSWQASQPTPGNVETRSADLNQDGVVDVADIQTFCGGRLAGDLAFDFDGDGDVDQDDQAQYIVGSLRSTFGDANLDGVFNSQDFVTVFQAGEFEDGLLANSTWDEGDWNCDGEFDSQDFVVAFKTGDYEAEAAAAVVAAPVASLAEIAASRIAIQQHSVLRSDKTIAQDSSANPSSGGRPNDLTNASLRSSLFDDTDFSWDRVRSDVAASELVAEAFGQEFDTTNP